MASSLTNPLLLVGGVDKSVPNCYNPKTITKHSFSSFLSSSPPPFPPRVRASKLRNNKKSRGQEGKLIVRAAGAENMSTTTTPTEKLGIKIQKNPPESKLTQLGVRNWPKWGCPPSKFPWTYSSKETCYLLKGKVKVYPDGSDEAVEIGAGDFVEFPKGMSCTWDVSETVDKHYNFE
ncbi:hypothetical protein HYC85_019876 [Camellia sinensis]|uniref:(S)-ureidoglycine aminohydrolase cupin domain-containing protein n=1 Tax=Camellia sinensis TaxID=4442 RepID=A0A7J7GS34_CAMSI|nr:hypothetical protein HYC85_019876 [Camellia sinensis]